MLLVLIATISDVCHVLKFSSGRPQYCGMGNFDHMSFCWFLAISGGGDPGGDPPGELGELGDEFPGSGEFEVGVWIGSGSLGCSGLVALDLDDWLDIGFVPEVVGLDCQTRPILGIILYRKNT